MGSCSCMTEGKEGNEDARINVKEGMGKCIEGMKGAKWFLLFPGLVLISAFLLTYFLNPDVVQIIWLVITGTLIGLGLVFMTMISMWFRKMKKEVKA